MRFAARLILVALGLIAVGCNSTTTTPVGTPTTTLMPPANLTYVLDPTSVPNGASPAGILLHWDDVTGSTLASYRVYSRPSTSGSFALRGETSSNTFHDNGIPNLQYDVTAVDLNGAETGPSAAITVDQRLALEAPTSLSSIALDSAIHLDWTDNAFLANPTRFKWYRVYSASYSFAQNSCTNWALEGTTVSHEFLAAQLRNGVPLCFATSAVSVEGYESLWSPAWQDTPRPDGRNVLVWASAVNSARSGFRFWYDANGNGYPDPGELGLVQDGTRTDIDFRVSLNAADSSLWLNPVFVGDSLQLYQSTPIADLTSIHTAPATGYARNMIQAMPGYGYVFERWELGKLYYAALRVTATSHQYVIFDWSIQTNPGNPDLGAPAPLAPTGAPVVGSR